ncbi:MAG: hypothetical protein AAF387_14920 [Pseudomonadota bacterium]
MEFSVDQDVFLESFTIGCGLCVNSPIFDIVDQSSAMVISSANDAGVGDGVTVAFNGGPLLLTAGTAYRMELTGFGAAVQRNFQSWAFSPVPIPGALLLFGSGLLAFARSAMRTRK